MSIRSRHFRSTAGLTLIELLLVLALLVVIGAMAAPALDGAFSRAKLSNSADQIRGAWGRARVAAMQSGEIHLFRFELQGRNFQVVALSAEGMAPPVAADDTDETESTDRLHLSKKQLPEGIVFYASRLEPVDSSTGQTPIANAAAASTPEGWSMPIRFFPDGTTSDAIVVLAGEQDLGVQVTLRGLTGASAVSETHPKEAFRP
jgi:Tfp pilus assembly protein FimT